MPEQAFVVRTQTEAFRAELAMSWCGSIRALCMFSLAEIPLYLHQGHQTGKIDDLRSDMYLNENEKRYYGDYFGPGQAAAHQKW